MKVNGLEISEMESVSKDGQMELFMKVSGKTTKHKEKANLPIQTVTTTKETGLMIKPTEEEPTSTAKLVLGMKDIGKLICKMDQELKFIVMETNMKECLNMAKEMEKAPTTMQLEKSIKEVGSMEESRVLAFASGLMERSTKVNGRTTKNMEREYTHGLIKENMKEIIEMIRSTAMEPTPGLTTDSTSANGKTTKDMEKAHT